MWWIILLAVNFQKKELLKEQKYDFEKYATVEHFYFLLYLLSIGDTNIDNWWWCLFISGLTSTIVIITSDKLDHYQVSFRIKSWILSCAICKLGHFYFISLEGGERGGGLAS